MGGRMRRCGQIEICAADAKDADVLAWWRHINVPEGPYTGAVISAGCHQRATTRTATVSPADLGTRETCASREGESSTGREGLKEEQMRDDHVWAIARMMREAAGRIASYTVEVQHWTSRTYSGQARETYRLYAGSWERERGVDVASMDLLEGTVWVMPHRYLTGRENSVFLGTAVETAMSAIRDYAAIHSRPSHTSRVLGYREEPMCWLLEN